MALHPIARATPTEDFSVAIEWRDGATSRIDFGPEIARGGVLSAPSEPAVFLHRLFVQSSDDSLAWETPAGLVDFHADELWLRAHGRSAAVE